MRTPTRVQEWSPGSSMEAPGQQSLSMTILLIHQMPRRESMLFSLLIFVSFALGFAPLRFEGPYTFRFVISVLNLASIWPDHVHPPALASRTSFPQASTLFFWLPTRDCRPAWSGDVVVSKKALSARRPVGERFARIDVGIVFGRTGYSSAWREVCGCVQHSGRCHIAGGLNAPRKSLEIFLSWAFQVGQWDMIRSSCVLGRQLLC